MPRQPGSRNEPKPVLQASDPFAPLKQGFRFLIDKGANEKFLAFFVMQLRQKWQEKNLLYKKLRRAAPTEADYATLEKTAKIISNWLDPEKGNPILTPIITSATPGFTTEDDCNAFKRLPGQLAALVKLGRTLAGPTEVKRRKGKRATQPLLKRAMPRLLDYYGYLLGFCKYVKQSTGENHNTIVANMLSCVLGTVTAKGVEKQIERARLYGKQQNLPPNLQSALSHPYFTFDDKN